MVNEDHPLTPQLTPSQQRRQSADSDSRQRHYVNVSPGENPAAVSTCQALSDPLAQRVGGGYISNGLPLANRRTNVPSELRLPGQHPSPSSTINNNQSSSAGLVTNTYNFIFFTTVGVKQRDINWQCPEMIVDCRVKVKVSEGRHQHFKKWTGSSSAWLAYHRSLILSRKINDSYNPTDQNPTALVVTLPVLSRWCCGQRPLRISGTGGVHWDRVRRNSNSLCASGRTHPEFLSALKLSRRSRCFTARNLFCGGFW